jgi:hypothetical protein
MQPKSNTEFVEELMEFSDYGAMAQVAVIEALRFYTKMVVTSQRPAKGPPGQMIDQQFWWDTNADLHRQIMERLHPEQHKKIQTELAKRCAYEPASKLGRESFLLGEWKKFESDL